MEQECFQYTCYVTKSMHRNHETVPSSVWLIHRSFNTLSHTINIIKKRWLRCKLSPFNLYLLFKLELWKLSKVWVRLMLILAYQHYCFPQTWRVTFHFVSLSFALRINCINFLIVSLKYSCGVIWKHCHSALSETSLFWHVGMTASCMWHLSTLFLSDS